jgi:hypothetical protein
VNFRVVNKGEGKTKNDYFQEMLAEVLAWGLEPAFVTGDSWYSCVTTLNGSSTTCAPCGYYACAHSNDEQTKTLGRQSFTEQHDRHWQIEQYHRAIKQVCNIERFQVRSKTAIRNHIFAAICGFIQLQKLSFAQIISNCYAVQRNLFNGVVASFVETLMPTLVHLSPEFRPSVNA